MLRSSRRLGNQRDGLFENVEMNMKSDTMTTVRKYFTVETAPRKPNKWLVICEKCGSMWHLDKEANHPGNVLHLLNHARGHDKKKPPVKPKREPLDVLFGDC